MFSAQALGFARMFSSDGKMAAHRKAAQAGCCELRTCCISLGKYCHGACQEKCGVCDMKE